MNLHDGRSPDLGPNLSVLKDCTQRLRATEVLDAYERGRFSPGLGAGPTFGYSACAFWFYVAVDVGSADATWVLALENPRVDEFEGFVIHGGEVTSLGVSGSSIPIRSRPVVHRHPALRLPAESKGVVRLLIRVATTDVAAFPLRLIEASTLDRLERDHHLVQGFYFGVMAFASVLNLILFLFLRDRTYVQHAAFLTSYAMYQVAVGGLGFEYLWPGSPDVNRHLIPTFTGLTLVTALLFSRTFLSLRTHAPRLYGMTGGLVAASTLLVGLSPFLPTNVTGAMGSILGLPTVLVLGASGMQTLRAGLRHARYYMSAGTFCLLGVLLHTLRNFATLPDNLVTESGNQIGSALAVLLLGLALGARFTGLQRDREKAIARDFESRRLAADHQRLALESELQALQAKINPHFLFNTLNTIAELIAEDAPRAEDAVVKLSSLFRHALTASETDRVPLLKELTILRDYLEIESIRQGPRLAYTVDTKGDLSRVQIPGLTLQPLVENAIKHGLHPKRDGGTVTVTAEAIHEICRITVVDDGVGIGPALVEGHGLSSVRARLGLAYGEAATMRLSNGPGLRIEITIPAENLS